MTEQTEEQKNAEYRAAVKGSVSKMEEILRAVIEKHPDGSDVQFVGGDQVWVHENGAEHRTAIPMTDALLLQWADAFGLKRGGAMELYKGAKGTLEIAQDLIDIRLRMTWRRQYGRNGRIGLNVRLLPSEAPKYNSARYANNPIPQALIDMVLNNTAGLILFEGPTGSGKSTIQSSLVDLVNETQARHIYTLEDPIEFVHQSKRSLVTQREIHTDVDSFYQGLQTAKRSKPGIILLGELRDPATKRAALESAGEGHLVLATSHASSVPEAVSSFIGAFPSDEQNDVAQRMASSLLGVLVQRLIPSTDGKVVPVREMLTVTDVVASKLRDREKGDLRAVLMSSEARQDPGTFSKDDDLFKLAIAGIVDDEVALKHAVARGELEDRIRMNRPIPTGGRR